jgi:mono/diheme cytochrome c family protein
MTHAFQPSIRALVGMAALGAACSSTSLGAPPKALSAARARNPDGAALYARECAACHGKSGEGLSTAPEVMGPTALPPFARSDDSMTNSLQLQTDIERERLQPPGEPSRPVFRNAEDVFNYVSKWMPLPKERIGSLKAEEYWAIVNYLLIANGSPVPSSGVNAANASTVPLHD